MVSILEGIAEVPIRKHPYEAASWDDRVKHYDFISHPELIRQLLEDFEPWEIYPSIETFYNFLAWINRPDGSLESSDSRLEKPRQLVSDTQVLVKLQGRVMIFFRDHSLNLAAIDGSAFAVSQELANLAVCSNDLLNSPNESDSESGSYFQIFFFPTQYESGFGHQITFQFNCLGSNDEQSFNIFGQMIEVLRNALERNT